MNKKRANAHARLISRSHIEVLNAQGDLRRLGWAWRKVASYLRGSERRAALACARSFEREDARRSLVVCDELLGTMASLDAAYARRAADEIERLDEDVYTAAVYALTATDGRYPASKQEMKVARRARAARRAQGSVL